VKDELRKCEDYVKVNYCLYPIVSSKKVYVKGKGRKRQEIADEEISSKE
jgi:hypothetical protein